MPVESDIPVPTEIIPNTLEAVLRGAGEQTSRVGQPVMIFGDTIPVMAATIIRDDVYPSFLVDGALTDIVFFETEDGSIYNSLEMGYSRIPGA